MEAFLTSEGLLALVTLTFLEIVLGVDNVIFISILAGKLPVGIAAVVSMVVGLAIASLGVNQASVINFEGPLSHALNDADIGFPLAIIVAGVLYFFLRRWELARYKR